MGIVEHPLAGPVLRLRFEDDEALVAPDGGQVVSWRHRGRDMLWCASTRLPGKPLRGGIPICWPWFGTHPTDSSKPAHGFARQSKWEVLQHEASAALLRLAHDDLEALLEVSLSEVLRVSLTTRNLGAEPVAISAALHTYFAVDDISRVSVSGLDGAAYIDTLDGWSRKNQQGDLRFEAEVDRIYAVPAAEFTDGDRRLRIGSAGTSRSLVAWNPWVAKSARLGDMAEGEYRRMLCLETAWAADDARTLPPGHSGTLTTILRPLGP